MLRRTLAGMGILLGISLILGGCVPQFDSDFLKANSEKIRANTQAAELIFIGTITTVAPSPPAWSGLLEVRQTVTYTIDDIIKGSFGGSEITVAHLVVAQSHHADTATVGLSPAIFSSGSKLIVFAREENGNLEDFDENLGTIPFSETNERALGAYL